MKHGVEAAQIVDLDIAQVLFDMGDLGDFAAWRERAALIEVDVVPDDVMAGLQEQRRHDRADIAQMTCNKHPHDDLSDDAGVLCPLPIFNRRRPSYTTFDRRVVWPAVTKRCGLACSDCRFARLRPI